ncbi:glutamine synthetase family protein [soil metagenome]
MTPEELRQRVTDREIDTVVLAFCDHYGRLLGKRVDAEFFLSGLDAGGDRAGTHVCDYLFTVDMEMEPADGFKFASWSTGYGDVHLVPDLDTARAAAWAPGTAWVMCDVAVVDTHEPVSVAPRSILRRAVDRLSDQGLTAMAGSELEFFVFDHSYRDASRAGYAGLEPAGWYVEDYHLLQGARMEPYVGAARRALRDSGIPVENSKGEAGRGQHEINIRYTDVLAMADRHALMKHAMKELADSMGTSVTFMAKPHTDDVGSSCHLHLSLWRDGRNAFVDHEGRPSDVFRWFLAGWMAHVDDFMVCYAPTINSYKRYRDLSWAPTRVAWAHDNRTAGFRVVGEGDSLRIECRIPGADVNPYLAYAAALHSGLLGIEQQLEPPPEFSGDAYSAGDDLEALPTSLEHAVFSFRSSEMAINAFGADVVEHYTRAHSVEVEAHARAVSDWERARYFERI